MDTFPFFLAEVALRSSVILTLGLGLVWAMKRASASERHLVLALTLTAVVCIAVGVLAFPRLTWAITLPNLLQWGEPTTIQTASVPVLASKHLLIREPVPKYEEKMISVSNWFTISNGICALFFFGTVTQLALLGRSLFWWHSLKRDARTMRVSAEVLRKAANFAGIKLPPVLISTRLEVPVLWGWLNPVILLSQEASQWSTYRLMMVLCHELSHFRRRDSLWLPLFCVLQIGYWWHPLVWIAISRLKQEREQACDDMVLIQLHVAPDYADLIVSTARRVNSMSSSVNALALTVACSGRSSLEARIRSILNPTLNRRPASGSNIALGLLTTTIVGGLIVTSQVQAEPAFSPSANFIKLQLKLVEISDKIFNQMAPANDVHFSEKTPCLILNGSVCIKSGQHGWYNAGVIQYYPFLSPVDNDKAGIPPTTGTAPHISYGINADFLWSKADNLLAVDSQVTTMDQNHSSDNKPERTKLLDYTVHAVKTRAVLAEGKEINISVGEVSPDDLISLKWEVNGGASPTEMNKPGAKNHLLLFVTRLPAKE